VCVCNVNGTVGLFYC